MGKTDSKAKKIKKREAENAAKKAEPVSPGDHFPIVGIGASAGGLEAFKELFRALPADTGMGFVLIQHLDPTHESLAPEILSRATPMPVHEVKDGMRVDPGHVYVIPPNHDMLLMHGVLSLLPRRFEAHGLHMGIDSFFQSLAQDQKEKAIGVILSGTASDGTEGLKAIQSEGGLTIAQDPKSTSFSGMPENAIASGAVDLVLPPKEIARELARIARHPYLAAAAKGTVRTKAVPEDHDESKDGFEIEPSEDLRKIFVLLRKYTRIDFSNYKLTTIRRRIQRRMLVRKSESLEAYASELLDNPSEVKALYNDILINVTEFFRDPDSFKRLRDWVFPKLVKNRATDAPIRIWVPGCSTGEEAYSLAILLLEFLSDKDTKIPMQIFATDIDEQAILTARAGVYPKAIENAVSKDRLTNFFEKSTGGYKIKKAIRDLCLFSKHDVTSDPPFSKLDLISCRNVLIYFEAGLQKRVIPLFHYALNPQGFLWLGRSEAPGRLSKLFALVDKTHKIFSKTNIPTPMTLRLPISARAVDFQTLPRQATEKNKGGGDLQRDAERITLSRYAPPSVIVNGDMEILQFQGRTVPYLEPVSGVPSNNLLKMARPELLHGIRTTIRSAMKKNAPARLEGLSWEADGKRRTVNIEVVPANPSAPPEQRNFMIFFEEASPFSKHAKDSAAGKRGQKRAQKKAIRGKQSQRILQLEEDLAVSKQSQQTMAEEYEAAQEELTSANEELQSTNEELQSTNEELETAKEELQSTNEEMNTVNDELEYRNADLVLLSSDLNNILTGVELPIVIVGNDRRIRRFTPKAENAFNLIAGDVGRPLSDIKPNFDVALDGLVSEVIESLRTQEREIQMHDGRWMRLQCRPYRTIDNRIDGVLISLVDITILKEHLAESQAALNYATSVADTLSLPLVVLDRHLRLLSANKGFTRMFEIVPHKDIGSDLMGVLGGRGWKIPHLRKLLSEVITEKQELKDFEVEHDFPELGHRIMLLNARRIKWQTTMPMALLLTIDDITERRMLARALERADKTKDIFLATLSHELRTPLSSILSWAQLIQRPNISPDKFKHGLQTIEQSARIQGQLIDDLLDVTRIQSGKLSVNFIEQDPREPVNLALEAVRHLAEKKHVAVEVEMKTQSETVWGDSERLQQIVWNLLTNAIKFSFAGGTIRIRVESMKTNGKKFVSIKIVDQGKGIQPEFLPEIFEPFTQADSSSVRTHGGLGLGLAIVRDLVQLHNGTVRADSEGLGKGATFTVLLPVKSEAPTPASEKVKIHSDKSAGEEIEPPDLTGLCVMIVEDETSALDALNETMKSFGAKTIPCASVAEALTAFKNLKPDILLSDIAMPGEDGYSLIRKIRKLGPERGGDIPSLALTAYAMETDVKRALSAGFDSHVAKPFDTFLLGHALAKLAKERKSARL